MRLYTKCDRCAVFAEVEDVGVLPPGWVPLAIGVRGLNDASNREGESADKVLCSACDDALYDWFYAREEQP